MAVTYADVLAKNVRAARARRGLEQEPLAARMRGLGFSAWRRQTVASVEKNTRRLTAEEVLGLALALETSLMSLMEPVREDGPVELPSGDEMLFGTVHELFWGGSDYTVSWDEDVPRFPVEEPPPGWREYGPLPLPRVRRGDPGHAESIRRAERKNPPRRPGPYTAEDLRPRVYPPDAEWEGDDE